MDEKEVLLILLAVAGLWLAWIAVRQLVAVLQLCRMRFAPGHVTLTGRNGMPAEIAAILDGAGERLRALGFAHEASFLVESALRNGDPEPVWQDVYRHAASAARAYVQLSETPEPGLLAVVAFQSTAAGREWRTENRRLHLHLPFPDDWHLADAHADSLAAHWQFHQARLPADEVSSPRDIAQLGRAVFDAWLDSGILRQRQDGWHLTLLAAWRYLRQLVAGQRRLARLPPMTEIEPEAQRLFADRRAWENQERLLAGLGMSRRGKVAWFVFSALLGFMAFAWLYSPHTAALLFVILLAHEFGHALAMRAFGYRNLGVLVLPFLGAVALGRKDDAGPWQKMAMLLAGPLPGLIVAAICLNLAARPGMAWLNEAGILLLTINLFNLLPLTPLDGGQIVETFVFARWPRLRAIFFALSALALFVVGYKLGSTVLAGVAVLLAFGIPHFWRRSRLEAGIGPEDAVGGILQRLHAIHGPRLPAFALRMQMLRGLLPALRGRRPSLLESLAGAAIYLLVVALPFLALRDTPVPGMLAGWFGPSVSARAAETRPDWEARLAAAGTPEERWQVLYGAGQWAASMEDDAAAQERFQAALDELGKTPDDAVNRLHRIDTRLAMARLARDETAQAAYLEMLPELRRLPPAQQGRLAEALEALNWLAYDHPELRRTYLEQAVSVREAMREGNNAYALHADRVELARLFDRSGDIAGAEALLRRNLDDQDHRDMRSRALLGWFLMAHARAAEAESLLKPGFFDRKPGLPEREALAWAYLVQGKRQEAGTLLVELFDEPGRQGRENRHRFETALDLVAAHAGDTELEARWRAQATDLHASLEGPAFRGVLGRLCREAESDHWETVRARARLNAFRQLPGIGNEVCPE